MAYATTADLDTRIGATRVAELSDDTAAVEQAWIDEAQVEIDSYLATQTSTPVDTAAYPELAKLLRKLTLDLAQYAAEVRKPPVPEEISKLRDNAVQWLRDAAKGLIELPSAGGLPDPVADEQYAEFSGDDRVFTRDAMSGW